MKKNKLRLFIVFTFILVICLALPCIAHADAPNLTGVMSQVNNDLGTTLNPIPKYGLPIFYTILGLLTLLKLGSLTKEYLEHRNDATQAKEITDKIIKVIGIAIGVAVVAPLVIMLINTLFGTQFIS